MGKTAASSMQRMTDSRRAQAFERIERLQERVSARNLDLTEEQAEAIAEELSQAAIASLIERGAIRFEPDKT